MSSIYIGKEPDGTFTMLTREHGEMVEYKTNMALIDILQNELVSFFGVEDEIEVRWKA